MEASYYSVLDTNTVQCHLCPNECVIADGGHGICRVRGNREGILYADAYGEAVTLAVDPVEKKPLYHFHPGKKILSTGPNGCNFHCGFCQNAEISQGRVRTISLDPETLVETARREDAVGIAYTYTEPFVWFEYIRDAGRIAHEQGLVNVLVTNGYVNKEPLRDLLPHIDAMNIDVKSMSNDFYADVCGGRLDDVLRTVRIAAEQCHVEVTNLIIPGYNDTDNDIIRLTDWLRSVSESIPLHLSRYFPWYRFAVPQTPPDTMQRAYDIASGKLKYVYVGNIHVGNTADTRCPECGNILIMRSGYEVTVSGITDGGCTKCGAATDIVGVA